MVVNFPGWKDPTGPVACLIRTAIDFLADHLIEDGHEHVTIDVVVLGDHFVDEAGNAIAGHVEGADIIAGAVFFEGDVDTAETDRYTLGIHSDAEAGAMFMTICHEMVHIMQYVDGTLRTVKEGTNVSNWWDGALHESKGDDYFEQPWEIQAYDLQEPLLDSLLNHLPFFNKLTSLGASE